MSDPRRDRRIERLRAHGASDRTTAEILAYDPLPYARTDAVPPLPLEDEPMAAAWRGYAAEARSEGAAATLARHLVQLRFPVRAGISETDEYRRATRRGEAAAADPFQPGLEWRDPASISMEVAATMAGGVPVIVAGDRADFVALVQALTGRNEPIEVPDAMGACLVKGLNNWSRIADLRAAWTARTGESDDAAWAVEFQQVVPRKDLYQDRIVVLSRGPYSATPAAAAGYGAGAWLDRSLAIRREHELTHYFTYRVFGSMRSHVVDELVADFIGLAIGGDGYRADLALRFLGLENFPAYRPGGRLEHYRGDPALSDDAFAVVQRLVVGAARNLEALAERAKPSPHDLAALGRLTVGLVSSTIEELASEDAVRAVWSDPA